MGRKLVCSAAIPVFAALVAGCGGGSAPASQFGPLQDPNCQAAVTDALQRLTGVPEREVHTRLLADEPTSKCAYRAGGERVTVEVNSTPQAALAFEAVNVHQVQANVGRPGKAPRNDFPRQVKGVGVLADWIPSEHQLITTNATRERGGAFVRVTIERRGKHAPRDRKVATVVARASLSTAPLGPAPGH